MKKLGSLEKGRHAFTTEDESILDIKSRMENADKIENHQKHFASKYLINCKNILYIKLNKMLHCVSMPSTSGIPADNSVIKSQCNPKELLYVQISWIDLTITRYDYDLVQTSNVESLTLEFESENEDVPVKKLNEPFANIVQSLIIPVLQMQNFKSKFC